MSSILNKLVPFGILSLSIVASSLFARNNTSDRIIGTNDLLHIPASFSSDPKVQAIGRISLGCTATHIGSGIAISAGHCFARDKFEGIQENLDCNDARHIVEWGVTYNSTGYMVSRCTNVLAMELNNERDYAIFQVSPAPNTRIELATDPIAVGKTISILSHPRKRPLEWSTWCKIEGFVPDRNNQQFYYSCDTEGGSSGASVLNEDFKIVGIHNYYTWTLDRNGATLISTTPAAALLKKAEQNAARNNALATSDAMIPNLALPLLASYAPLFFTRAFLKR